MRSRTRIVLTLILCTIAMNGIAQSAYMKAYNKAAAKRAMKAAEKGKVEAQVELGNFYLGRGLDGDEEQAVMWYRKAAEKNYDKAQYFLGFCYENGIGVKKDPTIAMRWYEKAVAQHNIEAEKALSSLRYQTLMTVREKEQEDIINQHPDNEQLQIPSEQPKTIHIGSEKMPDQTVISDIDRDIPALPQANKNTFAIIIANEDYQREAKVDFAKNDGVTFKKYCHQVLGLPEKNVHLVENGTLNNMIYELDWLGQVCKAYNGEASVIFYYAGHGVPDEASGNAYLLPADGIGNNMRTCLSTEELYKTLGDMPAKNITVLMDACFSGAKRSGEMLASARGVAIQAKQSAPKGNMVVLSAAKGDETAYSYKENQHGLFTYFLLKKLKETEGAATLGELAKYVKDEVGRFSIVENGKSQTPTVSASTALGDSWKKVTLK